MMEIENKARTISAFFHFQEPESTGNVVIIHTLSFIARNFNVRIYTNQANFLKEQLPGIQIIPIRHFKTENSSFLAMLSYCRKIARILNSDRSDAVFIGHNFAPIALWLKKTCFQYIYQTHEMLGLDKKSGFKKIDQLMSEHIIIRGIRASRANFVVSEPIIKYLETHKGQNLYLASHCVDLKRFTEPIFSDIHKAVRAKKEQGYFIVCYTGWISEERGLRLMLESLHLAIRKDTEIMFVVAGSDKHFTEEINDYFRERDIKEHVICLGKIESDKIPGVIALSDVCLSFLEDNPVYQMSPPQKVIEYMAAGKPVIANRIQTHSMLITDKYNGFLTDYNPIEISEKILYLKNNPEIHKSMCRNVVKTSARFDTAEAYREMKVVMNQVLDNS